MRQSIKPSRHIPGIILILLFFSLPALTRDGFYYAKVKKAIDGDTISLADGTMIRYIGIDTPEVNGPYTKAEPFGIEASEFNRRLVEGRRVKLELGSERTDKYGRTLAYVWSGDDMVNSELLKAGLARTLTIPPNTKFAELFGRLEKEARIKKIGIWSLN